MSIIMPGLSPRVRGNLLRRAFDTRQRRSIPACAGEPRASQLRWAISRVYPRVCGGTRRPPARGHRLPGLSPRVRGNPFSFSCCTIAYGSIPACAGEPAAVSRFWSVCEVYPRVCGGTARRRAAGRPTSGLSPRVRGNRRRPVSLFYCAGSIPACAGEPRRVGRAAQHHKVYPRVCGGTPKRSLLVLTFAKGVTP